MLFYNLKNGILNKMVCYDSVYMCYTGNVVTVVYICVIQEM